MNKIAIPLLALVFIVGTSLFYFQNQKTKKSIPILEEKIKKTDDIADKNKEAYHPEPVSTVSDTNSDSESVVENKETETSTNEKTIKIDRPKKNDIVSSPLEISGEARGWYFEASFPVEMLDSQGKLIGSTKAQAQSDWMTDQSVPFKAKIKFNPGEAAEGKLVFKKDNPSGNPELDESYEIPVRFKEADGEKIL